MGQYDNNNFIIEVKLRDNVSDTRWEPLFKMRPSVSFFKNYYKKNIVISYSAGAERIIRFLIDYKGGILKPDKFNSFEPINKRFDENDISHSIGMLASPGGCLYLKKTGIAEIEIENKTFSLLWVDGVYSEPIAPLPDYLTIITIFFPKKKNTDIGFIIQLMKDIKSFFKADNGKVFYQATKEIIAEE